jgi:putative GTP pyrophosphokinase
MILERKTGFNIEQIMTDTKINLPTDIPPGDMAKLFKDFLLMQHLYNAAIREVSTKLEILDEEFQVMYAHNPIHHIESRLKSPASIMKKLMKNGIRFDTKSVMEKITDIAGIRVICHYVDEVYAIADLLSKTSGFAVIRESDYIKSPKPNGYRSLHIIITVPVSLSKQTDRVPVEVQIRTIAMDFWASLEHQLRYKSGSEAPTDLQNQLKECADEISAIDLKMQNIYGQLKNHIDNQ